MDEGGAVYWDNRNRDTQSPSRPTGWEYIGPSPFVILCSVLGLKTVILMLGLALCYPHFISFFSMDLAVWIYSLPGVLAILEFGSWYMPAFFAFGLVLTFSLPIFFYQTTTYKVDFGRKLLVKNSFQHRNDNTLAMGLIYDLDIHYPRILHYLTGCGNLVLRYSTPHRKEEVLVLEWVKNPKKWRDQIMDRAGVRNARAATTF